MLPSLIMVVNPTVNYMLYESLIAELKGWKRKQTGKNLLAAPAAQAVSLQLVDYGKNSL